MKSLILSAILIMTLNYCGAQPQFPGGKPTVKTAGMKYLNGTWMYEKGVGYSFVYKLNAVNLQKAIAEFKKLIELNGTTEYKDKSIWDKNTEPDDYEMMKLDILTGRGELLLVTSVGDYVYGLTCNQELSSNIVIMVVSLKKG